MKKIVLVAALIISGTVAVYAQPPVANTSAVLNVNVTNVKSISVSSGATVNINLSDPAHFTAAAGNTGVSGDMVSTIDVVSNGAYKITASLSGGETMLKNTNNNATGITAIPVENIYLQVGNPRQIVNNSTVPSASFSIAKENLINSGDNLIATPSNMAGNGTAGTSGTKYDITYTLANYANVASLATGAFSGTVIYTITDL